MGKKILQDDWKFQCNRKPLGAQSALLSDFERFQQLLEKIFSSEFSLGEVCSEAQVTESAIYRARKFNRAPRKTTMRRLRHGLQRLERRALHHEA